MTIQFDHTLVAGIIAALLFSAFFSGLEIAFVSSNKMLFEIEREERGFTSRIIDIFYRHQSNFLSTLLVGNNIALVVYGIMMAHIVHGLILQTLIGTAIVLFVGEFLPKTLFRINPNGMLRVCAVPALLFYIILWPMSRLTSGLSSAILYMMGTRVKSDVRPANFGKADLDHLIQSNIDNIQDEDDIEEEVKMFQNALAFRDIKVRECIVPRTEIVAVGLDAQLPEIRSQFTDSGISKLIIYREDIDDIVGFLHSSEMFRLKPGDDWTRWSSMMKENYTVYVTAKVSKRFAYGDSLEIKVQQVDQLYDVKQRKLDKLTITMSADKLDDTFVSELTAMVNNNPGDTQFYIQLSEQGEEGTVSLTSANKKVDVNRQLLSFIQSNENIEYKIN